MNISMNVTNDVQTAYYEATNLRATINLLCRAIKTNKDGYYSKQSQLFSALKKKLKQTNEVITLLKPVNDHFSSANNNHIALNIVYLADIINAVDELQIDNEVSGIESFIVNESQHKTDTDGDIGNCAEGLWSIPILIKDTLLKATDTQQAA